MRLIQQTDVLKFSVIFSLSTPLMLRSGNTGEFADSEIETTPDKKEVHVNGYVWASLLRRAMARFPQSREFAEQIGNYPAEEEGVSPLWCESSFAPIHYTEIRPGIAIDRKHAVTTKASLHNDEILSPGHRLVMNFNCFYEKSECTSDENKPENQAVPSITGNLPLPDDDAYPLDEIGQTMVASFETALGVIHSGIETIGGGWSYGFGRLSVEEIRFAHLDLKSDPESRGRLFDFNPDAPWWETDRSAQIKANILSPKSPDRFTPSDSCRIRVSAGIVPGQLFAVNTAFLSMESDLPYGTLPDTFLYRSLYISGNGSRKNRIIIPGKAMRQGLFSVQIERKLWSMKKKADAKIVEQIKTWFGSTDARGKISIADAPVENEETEVIHRIQLCEHSMQNNNLFAGEYLKQGDFTFDILLDPVDLELKQIVCELLDEMCLRDTNPNTPGDQRDQSRQCDHHGRNASHAPPGWYRIGATSTCTGQVEIRSWEAMEAE